MRKAIPPTSSTPSAEAIDEAAAVWYARRDAGLTPAEQAEFEQWRLADPRHADVWRDYEDAFYGLDGAGETTMRAAMRQELLTRQRRRQWRVLAGVSAGVSVAAAAVVALTFRPQVVERPTDVAISSAAVVSKPERRVLPDGTVIELNRGADIAVSFTPGRRGVRLLSGEAHFEVTPDPLRPFVVDVQGVEVRAVGTAFAIRAEATLVDVVVTEGRVAVARATESATPLFADAGSRVTVHVTATPPQVDVIAAPEMDRALAWRGPRLELSGTPLAEAVTAFNRENRVQLRVADNTLAQKRMSGVFRADNAEGFARMLESNYEVLTERVGNEIVLRSRP